MRILFALLVAVTLFSCSKNSDANLNPTTTPYPSTALVDANSVVNTPANGTGFVQGENVTFRLYYYTVGGATIGTPTAVSFTSPKLPPAISGTDAANNIPVVSVTSGTEQSTTSSSASPYYDITFKVDTASGKFVSPGTSGRVWSINSVSVGSTSYTSTNKPTFKVSR